MGMFKFLEMTDNYEERKIDNTKIGECIIDTCSVNDSTEPYETGVAHPLYDDGEYVIVELYATKELAKKGHKKWVKIMSSKELPKELKDVSTSEIALMWADMDDDCRKMVKETS